MLKLLAFEMELDGDLSIIEGEFKNDKLYFKNEINTREFTNIEDYTLDLLNGNNESIQALIKSIQLDTTLENRIRNSKGDKLKVIYKPEDLPVEPLKFNEKR